MCIEPGQEIPLSCRVVSVSVCACVFVSVCVSRRATGRITCQNLHCVSVVETGVGGGT